MSLNHYSDPFGSPERRVQYEYRMAFDCLLPHLSRWGIEIKGMKVLDLGCGSGGLTVALSEMGADCLGIDLNPSYIAQAAQLASERFIRVEFVAADILNANELGRILTNRLFHLVLMSEFLEHLVTRQNVNVILSQVRKCLAPQGRAYVSFPPWFNPYGGHQAGWPIIRCIPWYHLIPSSAKHFIAPSQAAQYLEFFQELNHLTISSFEDIVKEAKLKIVKKELFHLRPEYYWRYRVPTIRASFLAKIPIIREITTTGAFYLLARY